MHDPALSGHIHVIEYWPPLKRWYFFFLFYDWLTNYSLGTRDTNFKGRNTRIDRNIFKSSPWRPGNIVIILNALWQRGKDSLNT